MKIICLSPYQEIILDIGYSVMHSEDREECSHAMTSFINLARLQVAVCLFSSLILGNTWFMIEIEVFRKGLLNMFNNGIWCDREWVRSSLLGCLLHFIHCQRRESSFCSLLSATVKEAEASTLFLVVHGGDLDQQSALDFLDFIGLIKRVPWLFQGRSSSILGLTFSIYPIHSQVSYIYIYLFDVDLSYIVRRPGYLSFSCLDSLLVYIFKWYNYN